MDDGRAEPSCTSLSYLFLFLSQLMAYVRKVPAWKARFGRECVSAVVHGTLTSRPPKYSVILELDRKIRDMALPGYAFGPDSDLGWGGPAERDGEGSRRKILEGKGLAETMSYYMPGNYRELSESFLPLDSNFLFFLSSSCNLRIYINLALFQHCSMFTEHSSPELLSITPTIR